MYIEDQTAAGTTNYNLYSVGAAARHYVAGLVGIGTTAPQYKLDVDASAGSTGNPLRLTGLLAGATSDSLLTSSSGIVRRMSMNGMAWTLSGNSGTNASSNFIGTIDAVAFVTRTNNAERMRVSSGGNVGIGTNAPANRLDVSGTFRALVDSVGFFVPNWTVSGNKCIAGVFTNNVSLTANPQVRFASNTTFWDHGMDGNNNYVIEEADAERLTILRGGNVGIGTTAPNSLLEVSGSLGVPITTTSAASLTLDGTHHTVIITTGSTTSITLPAASTCARRMYRIVNRTTGARTISTYQTVASGTSTSIAASTAITLQSDGTNWYRID